MDRNRFAELVHGAEVFTADDRDALQRMAEQYPFSAVVRVLSLMADKAMGNDLGHSKAEVAMLMADPSLIDAMLAKARPAAVAEPFDVLREINSYKEVSFKTAPKSVILSNFLSTGDFDMPTAEAAEEPSIAELGKKSISAKNSAESETLAVILAKQGRADKAVEIYRKLILKYPEKSSTFAARIAELELLTNKQ